MYRQSWLDLAERVDAIFKKIHAEYPTSFSCKTNCHQCCHPDLTVGPLEFAVIEDYLKADPERGELLLKNERMKPFGGKRCSFLLPNGTCGIYEVRPLVCRSHGAPLQYSDPDDGDQKLRDCCPLNFKEQSLESIPAASIINLDTVNTLLSVLNLRYFGKKAKRRDLKPSSFLVFDSK